MGKNIERRQALLNRNPSFLNSYHIWQVLGCQKCEKITSMTDLSDYIVNAGMRIAK